MNTVTQIKKHLQNCEKILNNFIGKYDIAYLVINDSVKASVRKKLDLKVNNEFDDFRVKEVDKILTDLYEEFRLYLQKNNIENTLYIKSEHNGWAVSKIVFKFEITN